MILVSIAVSADVHFSSIVCEGVSIFLASGTLEYFWNELHWLFLVPIFSGWFLSFLWLWSLWWDEHWLCSQFSQLRLVSVCCFLCCCSLISWAVRWIFTILITHLLAMIVMSCWSCNVWVLSVVLIVVLLFSILFIVKRHASSWCERYNTFPPLSSRMFILSVDSTDNLASPLQVCWSFTFREQFFSWWFVFVSFFFLWLLIIDYKTNSAYRLLFVSWVGRNHIEYSMPFSCNFSVSHSLHTGGIALNTTVLELDIDDDWIFRNYK